MQQGAPYKIIYLIPSPERVSGNIYNWTEARKSEHCFEDILLSIVIPMCPQLTGYGFGHVRNQFSAKM